MPVIPDEPRARTGSSTKTLAMRGIAPARGRGLLKRYRDRAVYEGMKGSGT